VEGNVPRTAPRSILHLSGHRERASLTVVREAPRPVGTEIWDEQFGASWYGYHFVRMRAPLAVCIGAGAIELEYRVGRIGVIDEELKRGRGGQRECGDVP
jgi:hypothetical protein